MPPEDTLIDSRKLRENAPAAREGKTIQELFEAYHAENPELYDLMVKFARVARAKGKARIGIELIIQRLRWDMMERGVHIGSGFRNEFRSRYARLIMEQEPDLDGMFEVRRLHTP